MLSSETLKTITIFWMGFGGRGGGGGGLGGFFLKNRRKGKCTPPATHSAGANYLLGRSKKTFLLSYEIPAVQ